MRQIRFALQGKIYTREVAGLCVRYIQPLEPRWQHRPSRGGALVVREYKPVSYDEAKDVWTCVSAAEYWV